MKRVFALAALLCGCYSPNVPNGQLKCSTNGNKCPSGFHCAVDGRCWKNGSDPSALGDMAQPPNVDMGGDMAKPSGGDGGVLTAAHKGVGTVSGGVTAHSEHYKVTMSTGDAPGGGAANSSAKFKKLPGVVGAIQSKTK